MKRMLTTALGCLLGGFLLVVGLSLIGARHAGTEMDAAMDKWTQKLSDEID